MRNISTIRLMPKALSKGHAAHRSGSGVHNDRRQRRQRTRQASNRRAMEE